MKPEDKKAKIYLDFVDLRDDILNVSGYLERDENSTKIIGVHNGEEITPTSFNYATRSGEKIFNFDLKIPIAETTSKIEIKSEEGRTLPIHFRDYCNLSEFCQYYVKDGKIVYYNGSFNVENFSYLKMIRLELNGLIQLLKSHPAHFIQSIILRISYILLFPFMKNKEIWLIMDRKTIADDNAEQFFRYANAQKDDVKKLFVIHNSSNDFNRLNEEFKGKILDCDSIKHKWHYMFCSKLISSQGSEFDLSPFNDQQYCQMAGHCNLDFYFLQHGITLHDISSWLVKYDRNPKLVVTSSELENDSFLSDKYNYDENIFQILGFPRYDRLNSSDEKIIAIMPTWRRNLEDENQLINSKYFKQLNSLLNNKRLIESAKNMDYKIIFKPHPELLPYLNCFTKNDFVEIDEIHKYHEIINKSSILVTDYSSVAFDFAYLKKPIIYYHYPDDDFHYNTEASYFKYDTMGFGELFDNEEDLIGKVIYYMDNGTCMEEEYQKRVDEFFKFNDHDNSERCYEAIRKN